MHLRATESGHATSTQLGLGGVNDPDPPRLAVSCELRHLCGRTAAGGRKCPLWVRSGHFAVSSRCLLYPRTVACPFSVCQQQTPPSNQEQSHIGGACVCFWTVGSI